MKYSCYKTLHYKHDVHCFSISSSVACDWLMLNQSQAIFAKSNAHRALYKLSMVTMPDREWLVRSAICVIDMASLCVPVDEEIFHGTITVLTCFC